MKGAQSLVQRILGFSSTDARYTIKQALDGAQHWIEKERSPVNNWAMNTPSGLVMARIRARNTAILRVSDLSLTS